MQNIRGGRLILEIKHPTDFTEQYKVRIIAQGHKDKNKELIVNT